MSLPGSTAILPLITLLMLPISSALAQASSAEPGSAVISAATSRQGQLRAGAAGIAAISPKAAAPLSAQPKIAQFETAQSEIAQLGIPQPRIVQSGTVQPEIAQAQTVQTQKVQTQKVQSQKVQSQTVQTQEVQAQEAQAQTAQAQTARVQAVEAQTRQTHSSQRQANQDQKDQIHSDEIPRGQTHRVKTHRGQTQSRVRLAQSTDNQRSHFEGLTSEDTSDLRRAPSAPVPVEQEAALSPSSSLLPSGPLFAQATQQDNGSSEAEGLSSSGLSNELDRLLEPPPPATLELRSWDEAMDYLRRYSTDEGIALAAIERAQGQSRQALSALLPNARFNAQLTLDVLNPSRPTFGQVGVGGQGGQGGEATPTAPLGMGSISLNQNILNLSSNAALAAARAQEESAKASLSDVRRRITQGLANAIVTVVAAERTAELNRLGLSQAIERLELTQKSFNLGAATRLDLYRVEQDTALARSAVIAGDERLKQARDALGLALGLHHDAGVASDFGLEGLVHQTEQRCRMVDDWQSRPDLVAAQKQVEAAEAGVRQVKSGYLPSLGLQSNISALTTDPGPGRVALWSLALVLNVPIWEGGLRGGLVSERQGLVEQSEEQAEQRRRQVALEVSRARRGVEVAEQLLMASRDARSFASSTDELTQRSFEVGRATSLELVQSAAALRQADIALATSEYDFVRARLDAFLTEATCEW